MFPSVQLKKTLSKILSLSSVTSRSKAQELIKSGKIKVNNQVIKQNVAVDVNSTIVIDGKKINVDITTKLWGVYKPKHVFCSTDKNYEYEEKRIFYNDYKRVLAENYKLQLPYKGDMEGAKKIQRKLLTSMELTGSSSTDQKTLTIKQSIMGELGKKRNNVRGIVNDGKSDIRDKNEFFKNNRIITRNNSKLNMNLFDFIKKKNILYESKNNVINFIPEHLIIVNSLNSLSEGIVLLTNDGDFANNLKHVNNNILTTYLIKTQEQLTDEKIKLLQKGCYVEHVHIRPLHVQVIKSGLVSKWIKLTYVEKSHTDIDKLFAKYNITIRKCKRFSFGPYRSSDLTQNFIMPLKIHSTIVHLIPKYNSKLTLCQPPGNMVTDTDDKFVYVQNYLKDSIVRDI
ncbi:RNA pseudouridylate synthase [Plasmodium brasilianum]|uniref:RNA pseudouridylate synthase n=1 Tax=Plasmodium brasilianum TaxID=5824 RepID=A0ACB9Y2F4_PLABR|nr:RNA pseudouridylate synthase [Plasmodium brasilianum]